MVEQPCNGNKRGEDNRVFSWFLQVEEDCRETAHAALHLHKHRGPWFIPPCMKISAARQAFVGKCEPPMAHEDLHGAGRTAVRAGRPPHWGIPFQGKARSDSAGYLCLLSSPAPPRVFLRGPFDGVPFVVLGLSLASAISHFTRSWCRFSGTSV